jgi:hypothetical protein
MVKISHINRDTDMSFKMPFKFPILWALVFGIAKIWFPTIPFWLVFLPFIVIIALMFMVGAVVLAAAIMKAK